jgi:hypothetical protein
VKYRLAIERVAADQLQSISLYYESQRIGLGEELEADIEIMLGAISENPWLYPIDNKDIHRALLTRFSQHIYYAVQGDLVTVLEFRDARRKPPFRG